VITNIFNIVIKTTIEKIKIGSKDYPPLLTHIPDPPKVLYCRGNKALLKTDCFSVVGTRKLTPYGREAAEFFVRTLSQNNFTIVSGLALGIDAVAHRTTLDVHGKTIAVLGSSIEDRHISPTTNFRLAMDILNNDGLIISEYESNIAAADFTFPRRNRIVSGLSLGVLVIEGDERSGTLITARLAAEQGRDVFAIPGNIFSPKSAGPNSLIQKGAKLVVHPDHILEEYQNLKICLDKTKIIGRNPLENTIVEMLNVNSPISIDAIIDETGEETQKIVATVSLMEMSGLIKEVSPGKYKINTK